MAPSLAWTLPGRCRPKWGVSVVQPEADAGRDGPLAALDEPALIEACLSGQPGAFDLIVERHRRHVYQLCYRFVGNHEDASDLSQDVFLRAYRGLQKFRGALDAWQSGREDFSVHPDPEGWKDRIPAAKDLKPAEVWFWRGMEP